MNKAKVMESVLEILHLDELSREGNSYDGVTVTAGNPLFSKRVKICNLNSAVLQIEMVGGQKVFISNGMSEDDVLKEIVNFIVDNIKEFYKEPKILCWGINCNLSYVKTLVEALNEE